MNEGQTSVESVSPFQICNLKSSAIGYNALSLQPSLRALIDFSLTETQIAGIIIFWLVLTCFTVIWFVLACFAWVLRFEVWRFSGLSRVASAKEEVWNLEFFPRAALALLPPPRPPGNFLSASGLI